jgi:hypothetical protein
MEKEFNFNDDSEIGTSVSKLKNNIDIKNTETDIDYDKILANYNNSDTINTKTNFNYDSVRNNMNTFTSTITDVRPKKNINMSQFAKNVESDLQKVNIHGYNYNEPLPVNYSKNLVQNTQLQKLEQTINSTPEIINNKPIKKEKEKEKPNIMKEYKDIIINVLIFNLLNNKFIIEFIYDKIPFVKKYNSPYPNLIIRSILFGLIIWSIKKFNI